MVYYPNQALDATFAALADPTRRAILAQLAAGELAVGSLAKPFAITPPAVTKHLKVLENAGLIVRRRQGQSLLCSINAAPLEAATNWLEVYRKFWDESFDRLDDYLEVMKATTAASSVQVTKRPAKKGKKRK